MGLGPFSILSLVYVVIGVRVAGQLLRSWRPTFDRRFTSVDRHLVDQAAFFLLVPIAVALHELGHAVAVWLLGGEVTGFGYYAFAGYVEHRGPPGAAENVAVAAAGSLVNLLLCAAALAAVLLRHHPFRAAVNELLIQFAILSAVNAFIFYPALDLVSGLHGDWYQIYTEGFDTAPALAGVVLAVHLAVLGLGWWAWRSPAVAQRLARLTAAPPGTERGLLGGLRPASTRGVTSANPSPATAMLAEAAERVISGWHSPVRLIPATSPDASAALTLLWPHQGALCAIVARTDPSGALDLLGATQNGSIPATGERGLTVRRRLAYLPAPISADQATLALRMAMEEMEHAP